MRLIGVSELVREIGKVRIGFKHETGSDLIESNSSRDGFRRNSGRVLKPPLELSSREIAVVGQLGYSKLTFLLIEQSRGNLDALEIDRLGKDSTDEKVFDTSDRSIVIIGQNLRFEFRSEQAPIISGIHAQAVWRVGVFRDERQRSPREEPGRNDPDRPVAGK